MTDNKIKVSVRVDPEDVETLERIADGCNALIVAESNHDRDPEFDIRRSAIHRAVLSQALEGLENNEYELFLPKAGNTKLADALEAADRADE